MPVVEMQKLVLIGNSSQREKLVKLLHTQECVQVIDAKNQKGMHYADRQSALEEYGSKKAKLDFMLDIVKSCLNESKVLIKEKRIDYNPVKKPFLAGKPSLTMQDFYNTPQLEESVFKAYGELYSLSQELLALKAEELKVKNAIAQLEPYKDVPAKLNSFKDTKNVSVVLGTVPSSKKSVLTKAEQEGAYVEYYDSGASCCVAVVYLKEKNEDIAKILSEAEFSVCTLDYSDTPSKVIEEKQNKISELRLQKERCIEKIIAFEYVLDDCKRLYDFYLVEEGKLLSEMRTSCSASSYILHAWVPKQKTEVLGELLEECELPLMFEFCEPQKDEKPPTYVEDNAVVDPYQSVTNMFSVPAYGEINPNPFVAVFFFAIFGMMLADAGYGLILTVMTGIVLAKQRPPKGQASLIKIIFMGGISTIIWGILLGSYFGFSASDLGLWYWFNPIEQPMSMLFLSLGMGIFQMCFGLGINMVAMFKQKKPLDAICGTLSWYFLIIGIALAFVPSLISDVNFPEWLPTVGYVLLVLGAVLLMASGALHKKGAKKITGALGSLYGIINFFSDLMSYTRIFGLGLASAVIGMVFNEIGNVIMGLIPIKAIGVIVAIFILLVGHVFNIGINALGAYVHNSRLQFVEFFGKFYTGGGELFKPLGSEMKYYYIKNQEVKK